MALALLANKMLKSKGNRENSSISWLVELHSNIKRRVELMIVTNSNPGVSIQSIKCLIEMPSEPGKSNQGLKIVRDSTTTIFIAIERHRIRQILQQMGDFRLATTTRT